MYCTVLCLALLPFVSSFLISKYPCNCFLMFFNILLGLFSCFVYCFLFWLFCVLVLFCVLFLLLYKAVSFKFLYKFPYHCQLVETQLQSINIIPYHKAAPWLEFIVLYSFTLTPFDHLMRPGVFKIQLTSDTEIHAIQTEGEAYNSVRLISW